MKMAVLWVGKIWNSRANSDFKSEQDSKVIQYLTLNDKPTDKFSVNFGTKNPIWNELQCVIPYHEILDFVYVKLESYT